MSDAVLITLIICGTLVALAVIGTIGKRKQREQKTAVSNRPEFTARKFYVVYTPTEEVLREELLPAGWDSDAVVDWMNAICDGVARGKEVHRSNVVWREVEVA